MQLSASSTFLDLLAASPAAAGGPPVPSAAGLPADTTAATGDFGALLSAQTKPAAAAVPPADSLLASTPPAGPGSMISPATNASGERGSAPLEAGMVPGSGTMPPALSAPLSAELLGETEVSAKSALSDEQSTSACTGGNAAPAASATALAAKGAPVIGAETAKPRSTPGSATAEFVQTSARPTPWNVPSPLVAAPGFSAAQPGSAARSAGKTSSVAEGHQEVSPQVAAEITAAWLAANGSTVLVANPAGELIAVDVSLIAPDAKASSVSGLADGRLAAETAAAPVMVGSGNVIGASLAGNTPPLPEQAARIGATSLPDSARSGPGNALRAASTTELSQPRDERHNESSSTASVSQKSPAYPAPGTSTPVQIAAPSAATSAHAPGAVNPPALNIPAATSSTPPMTRANSDSASSDTGTALDSASTADRTVDFQRSDTRAGRRPGDVGADGMFVTTNRPGSQPAISGGDSSTPHSYRAAEKIAGASEGEASALSSAPGGKLKNILAASSEGVTGRSSGLGINAAKPQARMPALAHPTPSPFADNEAMSFPTAPLTFDTLVQDTTEATANSFTSAARRAVDSAMAVVDHFSRGAQRGVNLQFSVSGLDLAVRVEMRPDGVHTIFRTDSPELRNALAQEWQSVVNTQQADRPQRLAEPVFTSTSAGGPTSGDHGASQQRESGTPQSQWEKATAFAPPAVARAATEMPLAAASTGPRLAPHGTARHLSAVA